MTIITRSALIEGEKGDLYKQFSAEIKSLEADRTVRFTITNGDRDRDNDTINPAGWDLESYRKNPVVLWAHDQRSLPVAKATALKMVDVQHTPAGHQGKLTADTQFMTDEEYQFGATVYRLIKGGYLNAVSVGFNPIEWKYREDGKDRGIDFLKQELMEYSVVPVPSNRGALAEAKSAGIDLAPLYDWAESVLDHSEDAVVVRMSGTSRELIEQARKEADPKGRVSLLVRGFAPEAAPVVEVDAIMTRFAESVEAATKRIEAAAREFESLSDDLPEGDGKKDTTPACGCGCGSPDDTGESKGVTADLVADVIREMARKQAAE